MKNGFVKSSPRFFSLIVRSAALLAVSLSIAALFIPAPLQIPADPAITPNPARSAWFLLWIQELVSWSKLMIYPALLLCLAMALLPWIAANRRIHRASWFPRELTAINLTALLLAAAVLALTIVAAFFRGTNWQLTF